MVPGIIQGTPQIGLDGKHIYLTHNVLDDTANIEHKFGKVSIIRPDRYGLVTTTEAVGAGLLSLLERPAPFSPLSSSYINKNGEETMYFTEAWSNGESPFGFLYQFNGTHIRGLRRTDFSSIVAPLLTSNGNSMFIVGTASSIYSWVDDDSQFTRQPTWSQVLGSTKQPIKQQPIVTPDGSVIYLLTRQREIFCVNAKTGDRIWVNDGKSTRPNVMQLSGDGSSLYSIGNDEGIITRYHASTGRILAQITCHELLYKTECTIPVEGSMYVSENGNKIKFASIYGDVYVIEFNEAAAYLSPTISPSFYPTFIPSEYATIRPSLVPSVNPTNLPSYLPSLDPTSKPSLIESEFPSFHPSFVPTVNPSFHPSFAPTLNPSFHPSLAPTVSPSFDPSNAPTASPSFRQSYAPSFYPSFLPSFYPSFLPSFLPSSTNPSFHPSQFPSAIPTHIPTTEKPTQKPSIKRTSRPTKIPTKVRKPTRHPTEITITKKPTKDPTKANVTKKPTKTPTSPVEMPSNMEISPSLPSLSPPLLSPAEPPTKVSGRVGKPTRAPSRKQITTIPIVSGPNHTKNVSSLSNFTSPVWSPIFSPSMPFFSPVTTIKPSVLRVQSPIRQPTPKSSSPSEAFIIDSITEASSPVLRESNITFEINTSALELEFLMETESISSNDVTTKHPNVFSVVFSVLFMTAICAVLSLVIASHRERWQKFHDDERVILNKNQFMD
jgi:hypothetical protein